MLYHTRGIAASDQARRAPSQGGLRTPGLLGERPIIGLILILLGSGLFAAMVANLEAHGALIQVDTQVANDLHRLALHSSPSLRNAIDFTSYVGLGWFFEGIGVLLGLYFLYKHFWAELSIFAIALGGEGLIWRVLTLVFDRPRPTFDTVIWKPLSSPSFPSGHAMTAVICFGLLAYFFVPKVPSLFGKIVVIAVAVLIMLYTGFARMYVGDHFLTDIVAGYAAGVVWSGLVITAVELISQRKASKQAVSQFPTQNS